MTMLTAYDYITAKNIDDAGIDSILVGDSLGMVMLGYPNTLAVTVDVMPLNNLYPMWCASFISTPCL